MWLRPSPLVLLCVCVLPQIIDEGSSPYLDTNLANRTAGEFELPTLPAWHLTLLARLPRGMLSSQAAAPRALDCCQTPRLGGTALPPPAAAQLGVTDAGLVESFLKHGINGYLFCNAPGMVMTQGER